MPQYLIQARKNGNVIKSITANGVVEVAGAFHEMAVVICQTADPELIRFLTVSVRQIPEGESPPLQYQGIVLFTIDPAQADTLTTPTLENVTEYMADAFTVGLDDEEHGNPYGVCKPVLFADTIVPAEFKPPELDVTMVCNYFRRKGYVQDAVCYYQGEKWKIVGFPFPTEAGVALTIRHHEDTAYVKQPDILLVSLIPQ